MTVHLGFVDAQGRLYDLNFRTTKRRLRDAEGALVVGEGERLEGPTSVEAALFVEAPRPHLLLRPTRGEAFASDRRLLFVAGDRVERTEEEPSAFAVAFRVPVSAVSHLFREAGGTEVIEVAKAEFQRLRKTRGDLSAEVRAPWIGGDGRFTLVLRPVEAASAALRPLSL